MKKKYLIMCVGYTHTGKTTFAKKIAKDIPNLVVIDNDDIASFINEKYPLVVFSKFNKEKSLKLKYLIARDVLELSLASGLNVILASGHGNKKNRLFVKKKAKKHGYELITIYFNLPKGVILNRISKTKKSTKIFRISKNWPEAFQRQQESVQYPPSKRNTIYFEIRNGNDYKKVFKEVKGLLLNNKTPRRRSLARGR